MQIIFQNCFAVNGGFIITVHFLVLLFLRKTTAPLPLLLQGQKLQGQKLQGQKALPRAQVDSLHLLNEKNKET
jgi:hypothetical protein